VRILRSLNKSRNFVSSYNSFARSYKKLLRQGEKPKFSLERPIVVRGPLLLHDGRRVGRVGGGVGRVVAEVVAADVGIFPPQHVAGHHDSR